MKDCCTSKITQRDDDTKKKLINRLSRIEGQIRGIRAMVERDAYCTDILTQSAAVNAAVSSFNREVLRRHINGCVADGIREGDDEIVGELCDIIAKLMP